MVSEVGGCTEVVAFSASRIASPKALATGGGNALPTCR